MSYIFRLERVPVMMDQVSQSWPGLPRPSTPCLMKFGKKDVDARDKRGHDGGGVM
jgi:hypothetical protein